MWHIAGQRRVGLDLALNIPTYDIMDTVQIMVAVLMSLNVMFEGGISFADVVTIKEGSTVTLNCSEQVNESIWYVSWTRVNNGSREAIATSYNTDGESPECNTENVLKGVSDCTVNTLFNSHAFTSQLTLLNVTADARQTLIQCVIKDEEEEEEEEYVENPYEIFIINSYVLNPYHLSSDVKCSSFLDVNGAINVSCVLSEVYPDIICRIFPELHRNLAKLGSQSQVTKLPELTNVTQFKKELERNTNYYEASCTSKHYPVEPGRYQFHVAVYTINDSTKPIANIATNSLDINAVRVSYKQSNLESNTDWPESQKAFYTLIGAILILGVSVFLIVSWVVWTKRGRCFSAPSAATAQNNEYETITYTVEHPLNQTSVPVGSSDEGYGASTGGDVVVSDTEADEETYPQKLLEERGYVLDVTVPRAHTAGRQQNAYIVPVTPTSTLSRSFEERRDYDLPVNDDNRSETHSKLCV